MDPILGVDLSLYQGGQGMSFKMFSALDEGGVQFAICRASLGTDFVDPSFGTNRKRATETKSWVFGAYHFLYGGDAAAQATLFVKTVQANGGTDGCLLVVDVERVETKEKSDDPRYDDVATWVKTVTDLTHGHPIGIYASEGYWRAMGNPDASSLGCYLWQARWIKGQRIGKVQLPEQPPRAGFGGWDGHPPLWQWGPLRVPELGRRVDGDAFYGPREALERLGGTTPLPPPPPDRPDFRAGYNATVAAITNAIGGVALPAGPPDGSFAAGVSAARDDIVETLGTLQLADPTEVK